MSLTVANPPTVAPTIQDRDATDHLDRDRQSSWFWTLVEALAYAGAAFDPAAALAARRLARIRDEELSHGRR
jgi:hypothetical protein